ncbi:uncharacterized protein E5676_scaffold529G00460 [Cucumis melo var. makuwa]|uniref:Uncharacterized protein n=1 Tax=Cucumis melo var. makuwa TaxID=1194695 RepID=A0A5A7SY03_CUCMM|nr:uncharacterized protein E6C27_scaffold56G001070 [Cucumis melo var. makuwa]TYK19079.1 uncharacterized protein E5676_scaffold529G00460 [Cucumis melo var. makuwa]
MALFGKRFSRIYGVSCQMTPEFKKKKGNKPSVDIAKNFSLFARCFWEDSQSLLGVPLFFICKGDEGYYHFPFFVAVFQGSPGMGILKKVKFLVRRAADDLERKLWSSDFAYAVWTNSLTS